MKRASRRGTVLVEFTIASIAFLTLTLGVVDFGRALYMYHLVSEVSREGARHAIVNGVASCAGGSPDPLQSYVSSQAPIAGSGSLTVTTTCSNSTVCATASSTNCSNASGCTATAAPYDTAGCIASVKVDYSFHFMVPLVSTLTLPMTSTSTMVISQ
jgi:Flp pilus assembly protein TadG